MTPLDVDDLFLAGEGVYSGLQAYKNSKLANVLFTYELSRKLEGSGVKVNAVCPGIGVGFIQPKAAADFGVSFASRKHKARTEHMWSGEKESVSRYFTATKER